MRKLWEYERLQLGSRGDSRSRLLSSGAKLRGDLGRTSFGKGMASAMPNQQLTSTALAAEVNKNGDVL
jgi:hypothetical protein